MNVLLRFRDMESKSAKPELTVVDWEGSTYGCPVSDLVLWVTEALVLEANHGDGKTMLSHFLTAYVHTAAEKIVTKDFVCKLCLAVGAALLLLVPSGLWGLSEDAVRVWTTRSMQFIRAGSSHDMAWISSSELSPLC